MKAIWRWQSCLKWEGLKLSLALGGSGPDHHDLHHTESRKEEPERGGCFLYQASTLCKAQVLHQWFSVGVWEMTLPPGDIGRCLETVRAVIARGG